jgi:hypothetical protein
MASLLLKAPAPIESRPDLRIGGRPMLHGQSWPHCGHCESALKFIAQVPLRVVIAPNVPDELLLMFICASGNPACRTSAGIRANAGVRTPRSAGMPSPIPGNDRTLLLPDSDGARLAFFPLGSEVNERVRNYNVAMNHHPMGTVLGQCGELPVWIQEDETPTCQSCGVRMRFAVQLEATGGGGIPLGDAGCAYGFVCLRCAGSAAVVTQSA